MANLRSKHLKSLSYIELLFVLITLFAYPSDTSVCARLPRMLTSNCACVPTSGILECPRDPMYNHPPAINGPLPRLPRGLRYVEIFNSNVTSFTSDALPTTLEYLGLPANGIRELPRRMPVALVTVNLRNNSLVNIRNLATLPNLVHIDVTLNQISSLPSRWTPTMEHIEVSHNRLETFPDLDNTHIEIIDALYNNISSIGELPATLKKLNVPYNKIHSLNFLPLSHLPNLELLDVYGNANLDLNHAGYMLLRYNYINHALQDFRAGNTDKSVTTFPSWVCNVFPNLQRISLYNSHIESIDATNHGSDIIPAPCMHTQLLNLHGNPLNNGINTTFLATTFPRLKYLTLSGSSIHCSCDLFKYITDNNITVDLESQQNFARCASPAQWAGFLLRENKPPVNCSHGDGIQVVLPQIDDVITTGSDVRFAGDDDVTTTENVVFGSAIVPKEPAWPLTTWALMGMALFVFILMAVALALCCRCMWAFVKPAKEKDNKLMHTIDEEKPTVAPRPPKQTSVMSHTSSVTSQSSSMTSQSSQRQKMKLPRHVTKADDMVIPLSMRRRFMDVKYDESAYLMPLSDRVRDATGQRPASGVYENDGDVPADPTMTAHEYLDLDDLAMTPHGPAMTPHAYLELDDLDFAVPADDDAYKYWRSNCLATNVDPLATNDDRLATNADPSATDSVTVSTKADNLDNSIAMGDNVLTTNNDVSLTTEKDMSDSGVAMGDNASTARPAAILTAIATETNSRDSGIAMGDNSLSKQGHSDEIHVNNEEENYSLPTVATPMQVSSKPSGSLATNADTVSSQSIANGVPCETAIQPKHLFNPIYATPNKTANSDTYLNPTPNPSNGIKPNVPYLKPITPRSNKNDNCDPTDLLTLLPDGTYIDILPEPKKRKNQRYTPSDITRELDDIIQTFCSDQPF